MTKIMKKAVLKSAAAALAILMALTFVPLTGAGYAQADDDWSSKPASVEFKAVTDECGVLTDAVASWDPVDGADGYMYRIYDVDMDMNWNNWKEAQAPESVGGKLQISVFDDIKTSSETYAVEVYAYKDDPDDWWDSRRSNSVKVVILRLETDETGMNAIELCVLPGSKTGECVRDHFISTLYKDGDDYFNNAEKEKKLIGVIPGSAGEYSSLEQFRQSAVFLPPNTVSDARITDETYLSAVWDSDLCPATNDLHVWKQVTEKATFGKNGGVHRKCENCGAVQGGCIFVKLTGATLSPTTYTYDGKAKTPAVTVMSVDGPLEKDQYKVTYKNNTNAGKASATVQMTSDFYYGTKTLYFTINKANNPMTVKGKTAIVKRAKVKQKAQTLKVAKVLNISKKQGALTFKKVKGSKKITVAKKTGKVKVLKGAKKGTYKVTVQVKAAGNSNYKALTKKVTFKVKVK